MGKKKLSQPYYQNPEQLKEHCFKKLLSVKKITKCDFFGGVRLKKIVRKRIAFLLCKISSQYSISTAQEPGNGYLLIIETQVFFYFILFIKLKLQN